MAKANDIKLAVDAIQTDVTEFGDMLGDIQAFTNETNVVVKDILNGRQISEWIADLETSGTASATYADSDRMNALIADTDACKNVKISQILLDWAVAQNKASIYFGSAIGNVSGVTWDNLSNVDAIMGNSAAFTMIANDSTVFSAVMKNAVCRPSIYRNYLVTEAVIRGSEVARTVLDKEKFVVEIYDAWDSPKSKPLTKNMYLIDVYFPDASQYATQAIDITKADGSSERFTFKFDGGNARDVQRMCQKVWITLLNTNSGTAIRAQARYVDFS